MKKIAHTALVLTLLVFSALICHNLYFQNDIKETDLQNESIQTLSKYGSRGEETKKIQQKLKNLGYYTYTVDGIFGSRTQTAVKAFQKDYGLAVDGIAGPKTLKALGISSGSAEARGEPYTGQVAVGAVILNRVKHPSFPNTLSGVIYQNGAFTAIVDGQINQPVASSAYNAARDALNGWDPTGGCIYYYNPKTAKNQWIRSLPIATTIGNHVFSRGK